MGTYPPIQQPVGQQQESLWGSWHWELGKEDALKSGRSQQARTCENLVLASRKAEPQADGTYGHDLCQPGPPLTRGAFSRGQCRRGGPEQVQEQKTWKPGGQGPSCPRGAAQGPLFSARKLGGSHCLVTVEWLGEYGHITQAYYCRVPLQSMPAHAGLLLSVQESWTHSAGLLL